MLLTCGVCVRACVHVCVCGCMHENVCVGVGVAVFFFWKQWFHDGVVVNCLLWLMSWVCHLIISHEMWHMRGNMCAGGRGKGNICDRGKTILYMVLMNIWIGKYMYKIVWNPNTHNDIGDYITAFVSENMDYNIFSLTVSLSCMEILRAWESHTNRNRLFISRWVVYVLCCTYKYSAGCQLCVYFPVFFNYQQHWWKIISLFVQFLTLGGTATQQ